MGFASFQGRGLSKENSYLVNSVPLLLREELEVLDTHIYSSREQELYRQYLIKRKIQEYRKQLQESRDEEEGLLFGENKTLQELRKKRAELNRTKSAYSEAIEWLENLDAESIYLEEEKPILVKEVAEREALFPRLQFSPLGFARRENLDLLVWGEIEEVQEYVFVKLHVFNTLLKKEVYQYETAGSIVDIQDSLGEAVYGIATQALGREWTSLTVIPEPPESFVIVNGNFMGTGKVSMKFLKPGMTTVKVTAPGYLDEQRSLFLHAREKNSENFNLLPMKTTLVSVFTDPQGADVYLDSQWFGKTPLTLDLIPPEQRLLIKKEGFRDVSLRLDDEAPASLNFTLRKQILDEVVWQERKRDAFYTTLGMFAISLPLPIFLYGYAVDSAIAANRAVPGSDDFAEHFRRMEITYGAYFATLFVSVTLFVRMFVTLAEYINFVDYVGE
jgi:hypothetical protein